MVYRLMILTKYILTSHEGNVDKTVAKTSGEVHFSATGMKTLAQLSTVVKLELKPILSVVVVVDFADMSISPTMSRREEKFNMRCIL